MDTCVPAATELPHEVHDELPEARQAMLKVPPALDAAPSVVTVVVRLKFAAWAVPTAESPATTPRRTALAKPILVFM